MVWVKSVTCITTCILLLQQSVAAIPLDTPKSLVKRGGSLSGKFLHITDIHLDPKYLEGASPDSYCHRHGNKRSSESGKYGALGTECDSPTALVDAAFNFLKKEVKDIDFIIYTGDTVRHDRDDDMPRTQGDVIAGHTSVMKYFQSTYSLKDTPYIPTIGNNDAFDHNDVNKNDKIFSKLKSIWSPLGLSLDHDFTSGGYFVQDIITDQLSVINLNSMYFFEKNDEVDDCDSSSSAGGVQMKWLESTLKSFQDKKGSQKVYLMGHVPPIDDDGSKLYKDSCYTQYMNLLGKYGSVISGHFTGHTNNDNLNAIVPTGSSNKHFGFIAAGDKKGKKQKSTLAKTSVGLFNAPSIIPVNNPAIRVYTYDTEGSEYPFGTIRDWEQYYVDLEKANDGGSADFELEYKASELYGVDHFDGAGVGEAIMNIAKDKKSRKLYKKYAKVST